jgi:large subunit ribosomal protein L5e
MFVKVVKNNAYFKRFQVRFRRRRQGKTDYYQRKRLINQRKNKYNTPKYRFVVRKTNAKIICQIVSSTIEGDLIRAQAISTELKKYGLTAGLTNYSASYATGLLCSRRLLTCLDKENANLENWESIANRFNIVPTTTGEYIDIEKASEMKDCGRPFTAFLDLGLQRSTNGARVFAAMKGAVDGGIHIPHNEKIFPRKKEVKKGGKPAKGGKKEEDTPAPLALRERIFGQHVQDYMNILTKKSKDAYINQFSKWDKCMKDAGVTKVEDLYKRVFEDIRKKPERAAMVKKTQKKVVRAGKDVNICTNGKHTYRNDVPLNNQQRKDRVAEKIKKFIEERKKAMTKKK